MRMPWKKSQKIEVWDDYYPYDSLEDKSAEELRIQAEDYADAEKDVRTMWTSIIGEITDHLSR